MELNDKTTKLTSELHTSSPLCNTWKVGGKKTPVKYFLLMEDSWFR